MIPGRTAIAHDPVAHPSASELSILLSRIDNHQKEIASLRPLDPDTLGRIVQRFRIDWNYHSNNIEGNSYDYGETKAFLLHGITAGGKPLRDSLEIKGHNEAILGPEDLIHSEMQLTEHTIREIHKKILGTEPYSISTGTPDSKLTKMVVPGRYKQEPNHVRTATGETFYFAQPSAVPAEMQELVEWCRAEDAKNELHPIILASPLHYRFVRIHPFDDGNGRMARILMNLVLMKNGFPVVIVKTEDKENYYRALRQADGQDLDAFVSYIAKQEIASQELWLRDARGESLEDVDKEIALLKASLRNPIMKKVIPRGDFIRETIELVLPPLSAYAEKTLQSFDELFNSRRVQARIRDFEGNGPDIDLENLSDVDFNKTRDVHLEFLWERSKDANLDIREIRIRLIEIIFYEGSFGIYSEVAYPESPRPYGEGLSEEEIHSLVNVWRPKILDYIRQRAKQAGYDL